MAASLSENILLHMDDPLALRVRYLRLWNHEAKCLHRAGSTKPGETCISAKKVRIINPEQISSTSASATCTTTSALRVRCRSRPWLCERPPSRRLAFTPVPA